MSKTLVRAPAQQDLFATMHPGPLPGGFTTNAVFTGGDGNDSLVGSSGDDTLLGGNGNDTIVAGQGHDSVDGGAGYDLLVVDDSALTSAVNLTISGQGSSGWNGSVGDGAANIVTFSNIEDFSVTGGSGADSLTALAVHGYLDGGSGEDTLTAGAGFTGINMYVHGGAGDDVIYNEGGGTYYGDAGNDIIRTEGSTSFPTGVITAYGGAGNDTFTAQGDLTYSFLSGDSGNDTLKLTGTATFQQFDAGNSSFETVTGSGAIKAADYGANIDLTYAASAGVVLYGGNDYADHLAGTQGADTIYGGAEDVLVGGEGNDIIHAVGDYYTVGSVNGGAGSDALVLDGDVTFANFNAGSAGIEALATNFDLINAGAGGSNINLAGVTLSGVVRMQGAAGADVLVGGIGSNSLSGGDNNDSLVGGGAADTLLGGNGADTIVAGHGSDSIDGGAGQDQLVIDQTSATAAMTLTVSGAGSSGYNGSFSNGAGDSGTFANIENLQFFGGSGADHITAPGLYGELDGNGGADTLTGGGAGGGALPLVNGGDGDDVLNNEGGGNFLGGVGDDLIHVEGSSTYAPGTVYAYGGAGNDTITVAGDCTHGTLTGETGNDTLSLTGTATFATLNALNSSLEKVSGSGHIVAAGSGANIDLSSAASAGVAIDGAAGHDNLTGTQGADTITGGANDTLNAGGGDDVIDVSGDLAQAALNGGAGTDTLGLDGDVTFASFNAAQAGFETLAAAGHIINVASGLADFSGLASVATVTIDGAASTSTIIGTNSDDSITGGGDADNLVGGAGNDTLVVHGSSNTVLGGSGDDQIYADDYTAAGAASLDGGAGNDTIVIQSDYTAATLLGGAGYDTLSADGKLFLSGFDGASSGIERVNCLDEIVGTGGDNLFDFTSVDTSYVQVSAGGGNDTLIGSSADITLYGGDGNDLLVAGRGGHDIVDGGSGIDTLVTDFSGLTSGVTMSTRSDPSGTPVDVVHVGSREVQASNIEALSVIGGSGDDHLAALAASATLLGADGDDTITAGAGRHTLDGGAGDDVFHVKGDLSNATLNGGAGTDTLALDGDVTFSSFNAAQAGIETLDAGGHAIHGSHVDLTGIASASAVTVMGAAGGDTLVGGYMTDDSLVGGAGDDSLSGLGGNDTLVAGGGDDTLLGGDGDDELHVTGDLTGSHLDAGFGTDTLVLDGDVTVGTVYAQEDDFEVLKANGHVINTSAAGVRVDLTGVTSVGVATVQGAAGADSLVGVTHGSDRLNGGDGADSLVGGPATDTLAGGDGDDTIVAGHGSDAVDGGAGVDCLVLDQFALTQAFSVTTSGAGSSGFDGSFSDTVGDSGTFANVDQVYVNAGSGDDNLSVVGAEATLYGGAGADTLTGGAAGPAFLNTPVYLVGGDGDDTLYNEGGSRLLGGAGDDVIHIEGHGDYAPGYFRAYGGDGADKITVSGDLSGGSIDGGAGNDTLVLTGATTVYQLDAGTSSIETIAGTGAIYAESYGAFIDLSSAASAGVSLIGGLGDDSLVGTQGADTIVGGAYDTLMGAVGDDLVHVAGDLRQSVLDGGAGTDTLVLDDYATLSNFVGAAAGFEALTTNGHVIYADVGGALVDLGGLTASDTVTVQGYTDADTLVGAVGSNNLSGDDGDDRLVGGPQADTLFGGNGDDTIVAGHGSDSVDGGDGHDSLVVDDSASSAAVTLQTSGADGTLTDTTGDAVTFSSIEQVLVTGGSGDDQMSLAGVAGQLDGGLGADTLAAGGANATLVAGDGDDVIHVFRDLTQSSVDGGAGSDTVVLDGDITVSDLTVFQAVEHLDTKGYVISGTSGDDDISISGLQVDGPLVVNGGDGDDALVGGGDNDVLTGGAGDDSVSGLGGDDTLAAGGGADTLVGGAGDDQLHVTGDLTQSSMDGGAGTDTLVLDGDISFTDFNATTAGIEVLVTQDHVINLNGGAADFSGVTSDDVVTIQGNLGTETIIGTDSADEISGAALGRGGDGGDILRTLADSSGQAFGDAGSDQIFLGFHTAGDGGAGNDTLFGGYQDTLVGGSGDDVAHLIGDLTEVSLDGGAGTDTLVLDDGVTLRSDFSGATAGFEALTTHGHEFSVSAGDTLVDLGGLTASGDVSVEGDHGADTLIGAIGSNSLSGSEGDDSLVGGPQADTLLGGAGNDRIVAGHGSDSVDGGDDSDTLVVDDSGSSAAITLQANGADGTLSDTAGDAVTFSNIEQVSVTGGSGDDQMSLYGVAGQLDGGSGADTLAGGGNDTLIGAAGDDELHVTGYLTQTSIDGGAGTDTLVLDNDIIFSDFSAPAASLEKLVTQGHTIYVNGGEVDFSGVTSSDTVILQAYYGTEIITGTDGADQVSGAQLVHGGGGDDHLSTTSGSFGQAFGDAGSDAISLDLATAGDGGAGDDTITASYGSSTLVGGDGDDKLIAVGNGNTVDGGAGRDIVFAYGNDDTVDGGSGDDLVLVKGTIGNAVLTGGSGTDTFDIAGDLTASSLQVAADGFEQVQANGAVIAESGVDSLLDLSGLSLIYSAALTLNGADGADTLFGSDGPNSVSGGDGNDSLVGGASDDTLLGGLGNDTIVAGDGSDTVDGGSGSDTLLVDDSGSSAAVTLVTSGGGGTLTDTAGDTVTFSGVEHLRITGGSGDDTLSGGANATLLGGAGDDVIHVSGNLTQSSIEGGAGSDTVVLDGDITVSSAAVFQGIEYLDSNSHAIIGTAGDDAIDFSGVAVQGGLAVYGGNGDDSLTGTGAADHLSGGEGDNTLRGGGGDDTIDAGSGYSLMDGGDGDDNLVSQGSGFATLLGGAGSDTIMARVIGSAGSSGEDLEGGDGDDVIAASGNLVGATLLGGDGTDTLVLQSYPSTTMHDYDASQSSFEQLSGRGTEVDGTADGDRISFDGLTDISGQGVQVLGLGGDDILKGASAGDTLLGGDGSDALFGGDGDDSLVAGDGQDTLIGGAGDDTLVGGAGGQSSLDGGAGDDLVHVTGDLTTTSIAGGGDNDTLTLDGDITVGDFDLSSLGLETLDVNGHSIVGGANGDHIDLAGIAVTGADTVASVSGGDGDDVLVGGKGLNNLSGGDGADSLVGGAADDTLAGGDGSDTIVAGQGGHDHVDGGAGSNLLVLDYSGTSDGVSLTHAQQGPAAGSVNDGSDGTVDYTSIGALDLRTGSGADSIAAGGGSETIQTGAGDDTISLGGSNSVYSVDAGDGNDFVRLSGDLTTSTLVGGGGVDSLEVFSTSVILSDFHAANAGFEEVFSLAGTIEGTAGDDVIDFSGIAAGYNTYGVQILGLGGDNSLTGSDADDILTGGSGSNTLSGGEGDDVLYSGWGAASLIGGDGSDSLYADHGFSSTGVLSWSTPAVHADGGDGDDVVHVAGDLTNTTLSGGAGFDTLDIESSAASIVSFDAAAAGFEAVTASGALTGTDIGDDVSFGGLQNGSSSPLTLNGAGGNDTLVGTTSADTITGGDGDDSIVGGGAGDSLDGGNGRDTLVGGAAATLVGGFGNDVVHAESGGNNVVSASAGSDTVYLAGDQSGGQIDGGDGTDTLVISGDLTLSNFTGTAAGFEVLAGAGAISGTGGDDVIDLSGMTLKGVRGVSIIGLGGHDRLVGTSGADTLKAVDGDDTLLGGAGDDTIYLAGAEGGGQVDGGAGTDTLVVSGALTLLNFTGTAAAFEVLTGAGAISGTSGDNVIDFSGMTWKGPGGLSIDGLGGHDSLAGAGGADTLHAADGHDTLLGGAGNDQITVEVNGGTVGADRLEGGAGNDVLTIPQLSLDGVAGETLLGGDGNDVINVGWVTDASLNGGAGTDTLNVGVYFETSHFIASAAGIERVTGPGIIAGDSDADVIDLTGVASAGAYIIANSGADSVAGSEGADTILASDGGDTLIGNGGADSIQALGAIDLVEGGSGDDAITAGFSLAAGATGDTLLGGDGNDTISLGGNGPAVLDGGAGTDTLALYADLTLSEFGAANRMEVLQAATFAISGTAENDSLDFGGLKMSTGLTLSGMDGDDSLRGGLRADTIDGGAGADRIHGGGSADAITGGDGADKLWGDAGGDTLNGGAGADTLVGGAGNDTYIVDDTRDLIQEDAAGGRDTVISSVSYSLSANLQTLILSGSADLNGTGNLGDNLIRGNGGANILAGLDGADTLDGGGGADTASYAAASAAVHVSLGIEGQQDTGGAGLDTLISIENLTGSAFEDGLTGNSQANVLSGRVGADTIIGAGGADLLTGGNGRDVFTFNALSDSSDRTGVDRITDLSNQLDHIDLHGIDADTTMDGDQAFRVVSSFDRHAGELVVSYDAGSNTTTVLGYTDSDKKADFTLLLTGDHTAFTGWVL